MASGSERPTAQPKIKLYWLNESRAQRFVWLLEGLGLQCDIDIFHRNQDMFAPAELQKIHPLGKSPHRNRYPPRPSGPGKGEAAGPRRERLHHPVSVRPLWPGSKTLLPERYRDGQEGKLGGETEQRMRFQYFLHCAEGSFHPPLLVELKVSCRGPGIPFLVRPIASFVADKFHGAFTTPEVPRHLAFLESQLETSPNNGAHLCGEHLTGSRHPLSFPLICAKTRMSGFREGKGGLRVSDKYPKLWAYHSAQSTNHRPSGSSTASSRRPWPWAQPGQQPPRGSWS
ncbi:hypothetical protein VTK56DRAFT_6722 [Thermocarpiscus australiensis]